MNLTWIILIILALLVCAVVTAMILFALGSNHSEAKLCTPEGRTGVHGLVLTGIGPHKDIEMCMRCGAQCRPSYASSTSHLLSEARRPAEDKDEPYIVEARLLNMWNNRPQGDDQWTTK